MAVGHVDANIETSWWSRPSGGREVLRVAAPLIVSSLSWTVMTFVDRMMLDWLSGAAMAAAFAAGIVWTAILCLPLGICTFANTFVSQYYGANQPRRIGAAVWQTVWIAVGFTPLMLAAIPLAPWIFAQAGHSPESYAYEVEYFQILCVGAPALLISQAASAFYSGRGQTRVLMWIDAAAALLNVVLDYFWIFGYAGFPAWGVAGAAWATVVSLWIKTIVYVLLPLQRAHREKYGTLSGLKLDLHLLRRVLYYGGPCGLQMLLDVAGFTVFILLLGRLGTTEAEATSMAFSISTVAFMPIWGLGLAVSVLVGQHLGENRDDLAARSTITALFMAWGYMAFMSALYLFAPGVFLQGFQSDVGGLTPERAAVQHLAVNLLRFVAAYNLLDATFMVFVNAIKGAGDTGFVLRFSLILAVLLSFFSWLGVEILHFGVYGCWMLITIWVWIAAATFYLRFRGGKWRTMRVIEAENPDLAPAASEILAAASAE